jgi:hypothetical protein
MQNIDLTKQVFQKRQYTKVVDTTFSQLVPQTVELVVSASLPTVDQFFSYYNQLFYDIPQFGTTNSHQYLIEQSTAYIGNIQSDEDVQALLDEINELRSENLELNRQVAQAQTTQTKEQAKQALDAIS